MRTHARARAHTANSHHASAQRAAGSWHNSGTKMLSLHQSLPHSEPREPRGIASTTCMRLCTGWGARGARRGRAARYLIIECRVVDAQTLVHMAADRRELFLQVGNLARTHVCKHGHVCTCARTCFGTQYARAQFGHAGHSRNALEPWSKVRPCEATVVLTV